METLRSQMQPDAQLSAGQLAMLDNTRNLILQSVSGLLLQLQAVDAQRQRLSGGETACTADPAALAIGAAVLFLLSNFGFWQQMQRVDAQIDQTENTQDCVEPAMISAEVAFALVRLLRLLQAGGTPVGEASAVDAPGLV